MKKNIKIKIVKTIYFYESDLNNSNLDEEINNLILEEELNTNLKNTKICKNCGTDTIMYKKSRKCILCYKNYCKEKYIKSKLPQ
jgi:hypothetical protein